MRRLQFAVRSLRFHWRMHVAVGLGVALGTAILTGALLVGDSMRGSLRDVAIGRLGAVDFALSAPRFFQESLAERVSQTATGYTVPPDSATAVPTPACSVAPVILLRGSVVHADRQTRVNQAVILGVDDRFWELHSTTPPAVEDTTNPTVILNSTLAGELGAGVGDDVLIHMGKPGVAPTETLFGRRDDATTTLRLTVRGILDERGVGGFSLEARQSSAPNAFVPLPVLQKAVQRSGRANTLLVANRFAEQETLATGVMTPEDVLSAALRSSVALDDLEVTLRLDQDRGYLSLESETVYLDPTIAEAALQTEGAPESRVSPILAHLANSISIEGSTVAVPYSTVVAMDPNGPESLQVGRLANQASPAVSPGAICLNDWTAQELGAKPGDRIALSYYVPVDGGGLETNTAVFTLTAVASLLSTSPVPPEGEQGWNVTNDPGFVPSYKGITDTENLADWDAPFPVDLSRMRKQDEAYWKTYRTTPKAFLSLEDGQRIWTSAAAARQVLTAVRRYPSPGSEIRLATFAEHWREEFLRKLSLDQIGMRFTAVRREALLASEGSTDFSMLFLGFSAFLIAVAAMLSVLLFRLGMERRTSGIGVLLAIGLRPLTILRLLMVEAAFPLTLGTGVGLGLAGGYAWVMLAGLRTIWSAVANAPFLRLHTSTMSYIFGATGSLLFGVATIAVSLRQFARLPIHRLLRQDTETHSTRLGYGKGLVLQAVSTFAVSIALALIGMQFQALRRAGCFFGGGATAVVGFVLFLRAGLLRAPFRSGASIGAMSWTRFGVRNVARNPGRSLLIVGLVACASFLIVAIESFRLRQEIDASSTVSGTGGFTTVAATTTPIPFDLAEQRNWDSLNLTASTQGLLQHSSVFSFRVREGDAASCLNLYKKGNPRIVGAPPTMIARGGLKFSGTVKLPGSVDENPWKLLEQRFDDGAIPAFGDEAAVLWQLKSGLGHDFPVRDERGQEVRLRFVGLLSNSILQDELIVSESHFRELFPSVGGYGFFLLSAGNDAMELEGALESDLNRFGFDAQDAVRRLQAFQAVQNTYLSTFQLLGGLSLVLGSVGLGIIVVRNVWERRRELALLQTLGIGRRALSWYVLIENVALLAYGQVAGFASALVAVAPGVLDGSGSPPWRLFGWVSMGASLVAVATGVTAMRLELRTPPLPALRNE